MDKSKGANHVISTVGSFGKNCEGGDVGFLFGGTSHLRLYQEVLRLGFLGKRINNEMETDTKGKVKYGINLVMLRPKQ